MSQKENKLEQWKFFAETTLNVSNRRLRNNRFYLKLLLGLLTVVGIGTELGFIHPIGILIAGIIGFPVCVLWYFHILSYKQLNSGKYQVLEEMAEDLPYKPFQKEWEILDEGKDPKTYIKHTSVEVWWPRVIGLPFSLMIIYGILQTFSLMQYYSTLLAVVLAVWSVYYVSVLIEKPLFGTLNEVFNSKISYITNYRGESR